jgi:hypothetical protein
MSLPTDSLPTEVLKDLRAADEATELYPFPACRANRDGCHRVRYKPGKSTLTNEFPEYEIRVYIQQRNNWSDHIFDSINRTAYRAAISALTDNIRTCTIKLSHKWLPVGFRERRCGAATARKAFNLRLFLTCTFAIIGQLGVTNHRSAYNAPQKHIHCSRPSMHRCKRYPALVPS